MGCHAYHSSVALIPLSISSSLISIDLASSRSADLPSFTGSAFRGWLGAVLRCTRPECLADCPDADRCPYRMVFKEEGADVRPYALLSFRDDGGVKGFIKVHGNRMRFVPEILSRIDQHENAGHFTGTPYRLAGISARKIDIPAFRLGKATTVTFVTPVHLEQNGHLALMPSFRTILAASVRAFNRVTKYFDQTHYPCRIPDDLLRIDTPIIDFSLEKVEVTRFAGSGKKLCFEGVTGWITYDTSQVPPEAGTLLKAGEYLQIGRHTTYGFGGIVPTRVKT